MELCSSHVRGLASRQARPENALYNLKRWHVDRYVEIFRLRGVWLTVRSHRLRRLDAHHRSFQHFRQSYCCKRCVVSPDLRYSNAEHCVVATIPFIFIFYFFYDIAYTPLLIAYTLEILPFNIRAKGFAVMVGFPARHFTFSFIDCA